MEIKPKKRLYDEQYSLSLNSGSTVNTIRRSHRLVDRLVNTDYKDFSKTKNGITDISQLSDKELKYVQRDYMIKGIKDLEIKNEILQRKEAREVSAKNALITPLYSLASKDHSIHIGYDRKNETTVLSSRYYNDNNHLPVWRSIKTQDLTKELRTYQTNSDFEYKKYNFHTSVLEGPILQKLSEINAGLDNYFSENKSLDFAPLNVKALSSPEELVGRHIQLNDLDNAKASFVVHAINGANLVLEKKFGNGNDFRLLNINRERTKRMAKAIKPVAVMDSKTIVGYNKENNNSYVGTITKGDSIKWQTKQDYLQSISGPKKDAFDKKLADGNYTLPQHKTKGYTKNGVKVLEIQKKNGQIGYTTDLKHFIKKTADEAREFVAGLSPTLPNIQVANKEKNLTNKAENRPELRL